MLQDLFLNTGLGRGIYRVDVFFMTMKSVPLVVWSGMYLYRELLKLFEQNDISFIHKSWKPFTISPIIEADSGKFINIGVLEPNKIYRFRFSTVDPSLFNIFKRAVHENQNLFNVIRIEARYIDPSISLENSETDRYIVLINIIFAPTLFKFHGSSILYPSPQRFFMSTLKDLYMVTGADLRKHLRKLFLNLEITSHRIRMAKLYIGKNDKDRIRYTKAFYGKATYLAVATHNHVQFINLLLNMAQSLGVGKSRAIGLGNVEIISTEIFKKGN